MEYGSLSIQLSWFCRSYLLAHCFFFCWAFRMHPFAPKKFMNVPHSHIFHLLMRVPVVLFFFFHLWVKFPFENFTLKFLLGLQTHSVITLRKWLKYSRSIVAKSDFSRKNVQSQIKIIYSAMMVNNSEQHSRYTIYTTQQNASVGPLLFADNYSAVSVGWKSKSCVLRQFEDVVKWKPTMRILIFYHQNFSSMNANE